MPAQEVSQSLRKTRGEQYPPPGDSPTKVVDYVDRLLKDGDGDAFERYKRASYNLQFADGRQWIDWNLRDKIWREAPQPEGRVRVTHDYILPILRARIQRLMSAELSWHATPDSNAHEARDKATVATNVVDSRWSGAEMDGKLRAAAWLSFSCGVAYLKQFWNPDLGGLVAATVILPHPFQIDPQTGQGVAAEYTVDSDGQPLVDPETGDPLSESDAAFRYRQGDVDSAVRSIFNIRLNPDAFGLLPAQGFRWLIDSEAVPISVIKEKYGDVAKNVQTVAGVAQLKQFEHLIKSVGYRRNPSIGGLGSGGRGKQLPDRDLTLLSEYWESPSEPLPEGRLIVVGGKELLYDGVLPQGFVPHVPIYDETRPFDAYGRATVGTLVSPQKVINIQWSLAIEEQALNGIGQWAMFDVPGLSEQITNISAAHIKIPVQSALANRSIGDIVQRIPPVTVSNDRWRMIDEAKRAMFDIGAFHEIQRGQVPPGLDSGVAIQLLQEADNGQLTDAVKTLKSSLLTWGKQVLGIARWGYGEHEERWIPVERPDLGFLLESINGTDLPDPETITLDLEGFRPQSRTAFNAEVRDAIDKQWIDPRQGLRLMDLGRGIEGAFESESRHYARARRENLSIEKGELTIIEAPEGTPLAGTPALLHPEDGSPYLLPMNDEHETHIKIHEEILLDDTKPWDVRQVMALHISEHHSMLQLQAKALAAAEAQANAATQAA